MDYVFILMTIIGGAIAASSFFIAKKPNAKQLFDKIAPFQGFVGLAMLGLGIYWLIRVLPHIGTALSSISGILTLAAITANILVGFLLGYGLLSSVLAKNEAAKEKGAAALAKITSIQIPLGLVTVGLGVYLLLITL